MTSGPADHGKCATHDFAGRFGILKDTKEGLKFKHVQIILGKNSAPKKTALYWKPMKS